MAEEQAAVLSFFAELGEAPPDGEVVEYLAGMLEENVDGDDLCDFLLGISPALAALPAAQQGELVHGLIAAAAGSITTSRSSSAGGTPAAPAATEAAAACTRQLAGLVLTSRPPNGSCTGAGTAAATTKQQQDPVPAGATAAGGEPGRQAADAQVAAALEMLRAVCPLPDPDPAFLRAVLTERCGGRMEAAAAWLLDSEDLGAEQVAWQAQQRATHEAAERAAQERQELKKKLVDKWQLEALPTGSSGKRGGAVQQLTAWQPAGAAKGEQQGKAAVRYRDGVRVTVKAGEKYIVEKVGEEWDGGSRGKIKTKGKRGKGWI